MMHLHYIQDGPAEEATLSVNRWNSQPWPRHTMPASSLGPNLVSPMSENKSDRWGGAVKRPSPVTIHAVTIQHLLAMLSCEHPDDRLASGYYRGVLVSELSPFHESGHKPNWTETKSNVIVRFGVDLLGKFDWVLVQFDLD